MSTKRYSRALWRRIERMYVDDKLNGRQIADRLAAEGVDAPHFVTIRQRMKKRGIARSRSEAYLLRYSRELRVDRAELRRVARVIKRLHPEMPASVIAQQMTTQVRRAFRARGESCDITIHAQAVRWWLRDLGTSNFVKRDSRVYEQAIKLRAASACLISAQKASKLLGVPKSTIAAWWRRAGLAGAGLTNWRTIEGREARAKAVASAIELCGLAPP